MTRRMGSVMAIGAAIVLIGGGIVLAKGHDGHGPGSHGHGHGLGGPGGTTDDGPGHGHGANGGGDDDGGAGAHGGGSAKGGGDTCDAASSVIGAFVDAACPCLGMDDGMGGTVAWKNHGQYVRCVAHAMKDAVRSAGLKRRCGRDVVPCAAQSSCGKRNAVTCLVATTGTCTNGACDVPAGAPCTTDADCGTKACGVTSANRCTTLGGTAGSGSCCSASPSGAFVE